ncbi:TPA: hypothetical protein HA242_05330 [Candidatus Woesearchaeota archaeon]|nr:hypothetical protein [Candidatus Woesearchaeota archaeon]HIH13120.1 hypothetical protein [Candidatus Woesearchaeota archaeon]
MEDQATRSYIGNIISLPDGYEVTFPDIPECDVKATPLQGLSLEKLQQTAERALYNHLLELSKCGKSIPPSEYLASQRSLDPTRYLRATIDLADLVTGAGSYAF